MSELYLYHFSTKDFSQFNLECQNPLHQALGAGIYTSDVLNFVQGKYDFTQQPELEFISQKRISVNRSAFVDIETYALYLQKKFNVDNVDLVQMILTERTDFPKQSRTDLMEKYKNEYVKNKKLQSANAQQLLNFIFENSVETQIAQISTPKRRVYKCVVSDDKGIIDASKTLKESKIKKIDMIKICDILDVDMNDIHQLLFRTEYLLNLKKQNEWRELWDEKHFSPTYRDKVFQRNEILKKLPQKPHENDKINQSEMRFRELKTEVLRLRNMKNKTNEATLLYEQLEKEAYKVCEELINHYFYSVPYGALHKNFIKKPQQCQKLSQYLGIKGLYTYQTVHDFDKSEQSSRAKQAFEKWFVLTDVSAVRIETYMGYDTKGQWQPVKRPPEVVLKNLKHRCKE